MHRNIIVRLVAYYLGVTAVMTGLFYAFPVLRQYVAAERARQGMRASLELDQIPATIAFSRRWPGPPSGSIPSGRFPSCSHWSPPSW